MSGRRRQTLSPTLFPFLAVLVCTLGTLILLLALVAQNTSETAEQLAEQMAEQAAAVKPKVDQQIASADQISIGDVQMLIEEEAFRLEQLVSFREAQTGDLEQRRSQLAHVEDHMRRIRQRLGELSRAMENAFSDQPLAAIDPQELDQLRQKIEIEKSKLKELSDSVTDGKPRVVIVPHKGPNGTNRRPVYVECTGKGVTIQPEGETISMWELRNSSVHANPLDDALRAARYHVMQEYGDSSPPYPMLIIRPDGIDAYFAARAAMRDWDDHFGYEMLEGDVVLKAGTADPGLKQKLQYAIKQSVNRIAKHAIARSTSGQSGPAGTTASRIAAAQSSRPPSRRKMPRLSARQLDQQRFQKGFADHRKFPQYTYGSSSSGQSESGVGREAATRRLEQQMRNSGFSTAEEELAGPLDSESMLKQLAENGSSAPPNGSAESNVGGQAAQQSTAGGSQESQSDAAKFNTQGYAFGGAVDSDRDGIAKSAAGQSDAQSQGTNAQATLSSPINGPSGPGPGRPLMGQASAAQARNSATSSQSPASAQAATAPPSRSNPQVNNSRPQSQLVQPRGTDWALPDRTGASSMNEIVRPVSIQIYADRIVLLPERSGGNSRGNTAESFYYNGGDMNEATLRFATAVRDRVVGWGAAMTGARWAPMLRVQVDAGAQAHYNHFRALLNGSGLQFDPGGPSVSSGVSRQAAGVVPGGIR